MRGFQPAKGKAKPFANGGPVRGPGTGTSDGVPDEVPNGTYIMPADSTQAMGEQQLATMGVDGKGVPVQLSNGEFKMPPEQVHAIGVQALDQMKNVTHQPVARGFAPGAEHAQEPEPPMFFADGGLVDEENRRKQTSPNNIFPGSQLPGSSGATSAPASAAPDPAPAPMSGPASSPQAQSDRAKIGAAWEMVKDVNDDAGRAIADVAMLVPRGLAGAYDSAVVRPMRAAGINANYLSPSLVPDGVDSSSLTPFTDQKRMRQPAAPLSVTPAAQVATPENSPPAVSVPASASTGYNTRNQGEMGPSNLSRLTTPAAPDATQAKQVLPGIYRSGNSYGDSEAATVTGAQPRGLPSAQNIAAADALAARSQQESISRVSEPQQATAAGWSGVIGQDPAAMRERKALMDALTTPVAGARGLTAAQRNGALSLMNQESQAQQAKDRNATSIQQTEMQNATQRDLTAMREVGDSGRAALREAGETSRSGARNTIDQGRLNLEQQARGFDIRASERQEKLYQRYAAADTLEKKAAIAQEIRDLSGKQTDSPWKIQVTPATKNIDGSTNEGSIYRYNGQTGQVERIDTGSAAAATPMPPKDQLKTGVLYQTPRGPARWDGKQFTPA